MVCFGRRLLSGDDTYDHNETKEKEEEQSGAQALGIDESGKWKGPPGEGHKSDWEPN
jgi:hypothetical protein